MKERLIVIIWTALIMIAAASLLVHNFVSPVQAASPAPPVVKECQKVNTAKVSDALTIIVFRCEPENGPPYLLNTVGFMKDEE